MTAPMNFPIRRYHAAEIFRAGPYSGTVWVCGGEYLEINKRTKKEEMIVSDTCECFNNYRLRWLLGPSMMESRKRMTSSGRALIIKISSHFFSMI